LPTGAIISDAIRFIAGSHRNHLFAGGEKVSHGFLAPIFQVRILAREPLKRPEFFQAPFSRNMTLNAPNPSMSVIILAAGAGTRMKSSIPKPLHDVAGRPMLAHVLDTARELDPVGITVVGSHEIDDHLSRSDWASGVRTVIQDPPRGTGDAVRLALEEESIGETVLVLYADHPLVTAEVLRALIVALTQADANVAVMTCIVDDAAGYGRIDRDLGGQVRAIIEKVDDDESLRNGLTEINSGVMALQRVWAREALATLEPNPRKNEYFLTDLISIAYDQDPKSVTSSSGTPEVLVGINDRFELADAEEMLYSKKRHQLLDSGVTLISPGSNYIAMDVQVGQDTIIGPNCIIDSGTRIGESCRIGPNAVIRASVIGDRVRIESSTIEHSTIGSDSDVGPYSHLRNGTSIGSNVHIGNFAELKNASVGDGVRVGHFSYLGDAKLGMNVNIGAGTVTCNYDGQEKHRTEIGDGAFIGSDSMLVAPVRIGADARTGAGAVVTRDVADGSTVVGMPARQVPKKQVGDPLARGEGEA
jgi:bifunctional UDP-N-acetylglucosamine pyrophosphorylase/glucosamine-1-phosphate N-acetyltransferase